MSVETGKNEALVVDFCLESMDLLEGLPDALAAHARDAADEESINRVFRAVHTIKGNAGFFGLPVVKQFAHKLEDALDRVRRKEASLNDALTRNMVDALDVLGDMVSQIQQGAADATVEPQHAELLDEINALCQDCEGASVESLLLAEVRALAREIAASNAPHAAAWSNRLQALVEATDSPDANDSPAEKDTETPSPATLAAGQFRCGDVDVTEQVRPLLALFTASGGSSELDSLSEAFLRAVAAFEKWAADNAQGELAAELAAVSRDADAVF
ncbi:MAG: Hpt domain-containing protein, partial [Planctomycetales bacterium]|nr:Hpt domain-containing protein [Planctomycetales bacterium]